MCQYIMPNISGYLLINRMSDAQPRLGTDLLDSGPVHSPQEPSLVSEPPCLPRWEDMSKGHILYTYSLSVYSKQVP